jgi:hypothetical protein
MQQLVEVWRKQWSVVPGTTAPLAPFGIVTLASGGSEGGDDIGGMRLSQTGNYGTLPSPEMPNTFLAHAFDMGDPWAKSPSCMGWGCCYKSYNASTCAAKTKGKPEVCTAACAGLLNTSYYMGPIHPRIKKPVGERMALAAHNLVYGGRHTRIYSIRMHCIHTVACTVYTLYSCTVYVLHPGTGAYSGPTISGCSASSTEITLLFNKTLLRGGSVAVKNYSVSGSAMHVLVDPQYWCKNTVLTPDYPALGEHL